MVLLSWNILHGGGPERTPEIALAILAYRPDLVVLTEFRVTRGGQIRAILADHGLVHQAAAHGSERANGILLAGREPLVRTLEDTKDRSEGRFLDVHLPESDLFVTGVHVPDDSDPGSKAFHWQRLVRVGRDRRDRRAIIIGDLNTGRRGQDAESGCFGCEALLGSLCSLGYVDGWRSLHPGVRDATWVAPWGEGRRIDAAYLSAPLAGDLLGAEHHHVERERGLSDHSALVVRLGESPRSGADSSKAGQNQTLFGAAAGIRSNFA